MRANLLNINNQKGIVLISVFIVMIMLFGLAGAFYVRAIQESRLVQRLDDSLQALYNAEKAVAYAHYEAASIGWSWFTHNWNKQKTTLVSNDLTSIDALRTQGTQADCHFITSGQFAGCYAANDGSFILKTFPDPQISTITLVRAIGISGGTQRVVESRVYRQAIFDFAWWSPYTFHLSDLAADDGIVHANGGRIHSNADIAMFSNERIQGVDNISTGLNHSIYYDSLQYQSPRVYDQTLTRGDGTDFDGTIPLPHLDGDPASNLLSARHWAGTTADQLEQIRFPWLREGRERWYWRSAEGVNAESYAGSGSAFWPGTAFRNEEFFFYGDNQAINNDPLTGFNQYNTWIYPAQKDAYGNISFNSSGQLIIKDPQQIPAELGAMWDWVKYASSDGNDPLLAKECRFTVYDPEGGTKYVEDTRWKIVTDSETGKLSVEMFDYDPDDPDPNKITYWEMLQQPAYYEALGYTPEEAGSFANHVNPEVLDGTYGSEITAGRKTISVDNTNSIMQSEAWNQFLEESGLENVLLANERGEDMEPPRFATTYKEQSKRTGLYFSKEPGTHTLNHANGEKLSYTIPEHNCDLDTYNLTDPDNYDPNDVVSYWQCIEDNVIDVLVERLNTDVNGQPLMEQKQSAKKVSFINTYTSQRAVMLELDLSKMDNVDSQPINGIIYSEIPLRLTNAQQLPSLSLSNKNTFNLICEENVYLKGNYNNPPSASDKKWMPSAVISKKHIYTLSEDFNDPQVRPATEIFPTSPYIYGRWEGENFIELDPETDMGGQWHKPSEYAAGSDELKVLRNLLSSLDEAWRETFEQSDPTGSQLYTVSGSGHPLIEGLTFGAKPNRVANDHTYNVMLVSFYNFQDEAKWDTGTYPGETIPLGGIPQGTNLERWWDVNKFINGAFFQMDWGDEDDPNRFTAHASDGPVDFYYFSGLAQRNEDEATPSNNTFAAEVNINPRFISSVNMPLLQSAYDQRFRNNALANNRPIFFGGGSPSWREISLADF